MHTLPPLKSPQVLEHLGALLSLNVDDILLLGRSIILTELDQKGNTLSPMDLPRTLTEKASLLFLTFL